MNLEDAIEARLAGQTMPPASEIPGDWDDALRAHEALVHALGETVVWEDLAPDRPPPELPADYAVECEIGRGGMGVVYLARQHSLGRQIAVKVLRPGESSLRGLVQRFMNEARHLAKLRHPNIVAIHEVGVAGDEPYFTMDYIDGRSLAELLESGKLPPSQAVHILKQAASAVAHAHSQGIIHRDLKPANLLLANSLPGSLPEVLVSDFGLARDLTTDSGATLSGAILGTPAYMSPEQARGQTHLIGEATDIHALGVLLYEMLTAQPPYGRDAPGEVLTRLLSSEPVPPRQLDRRIPRDLETICLKAIDKRPERRYGSVNALLADLVRWEQGDPIVARRASHAQRLVRLAGQHWRVLLAVAVTAAIALFAAPFLFDRSAATLIRWGEEKRAEGELAEAVELFRRAALVGKGSDRSRAQELMLRAAKDAGSTKGIVDAGLLIIHDDPTRSFGEHDYLIAQAVVGQVRAKNPNRVIRWTAEEHDPLLKLAARRLKVFLDQGGGTTAERTEAKTLLAEVQAELAGTTQLDASVESTPEPQLPAGSADELLTKARDDDQLPWQRGLAALAAAKQLEAEGKRADELAAYQLALQQMRRVYPFYEGIGNVYASVSGESSSARLDPSVESKWMKQVAEAIEKLDPEHPPLTSTGIRLRVQGVEIPPSISLAFWVHLYDGALGKDQRRLYEERTGSFDVDEVPLAADQSTWIGVVPGEYQLSVRQGSRGLAGTTHKDLYRRLILDFDGLPETIKVGQTAVELNIPARLMEDIELRSPKPGATVNLRDDTFRWTEIPGVKHYEVRFAILKSEPSGRSTMSSGPHLRTDQAQLRLSEASVPDWAKKQLQNGTSATWHVLAYDVNGRQIGVSTESDRAFVIAGELK